MTSTQQLDQIARVSTEALADALANEASTDANLVRAFLTADADRQSSPWWGVDPAEFGATHAALAIDPGALARIAKAASLV